MPFLFDRTGPPLRRNPLGVTKSGAMASSPRAFEPTGLGLRASTSRIYAIDGSGLNGAVDKFAKRDEISSVN